MFMICFQVITRRGENCPSLLPANAFKTDACSSSPSKLADSVYFDRHIIINALKTSGYDAGSIDIPYQPSPAPGELRYKVIFFCLDFIFISN